jgi:DNA-binding MarR family transcriptional regulator
VAVVTDTAPLDAEQLALYFALMEVSSLLQYAVEQQLRTDGGLSWVQFQILAGLNDRPDGRQRMTDIADRVVYSRSGLTYQANQLEKAGLIARTPDPSDERSTIVAVTAAGRALVRRVLPGHIAIVRETLLQHINHRDGATLSNVLARIRERMRATPPRSAAPRRAGGSASRRPRRSTRVES